MNATRTKWCTVDIPWPETTRAVMGGDRVRLGEDVRRGLRTLCELAGSRPDPDGSVAKAVEWVTKAAKLGASTATRTEALEPRKDHNAAIDLLVGAWEIEYGRKYPFAGRDAASVSRLRKMPDWSIETAMRRWRLLLHDPWWRARGIAIPDLEGQWTRLASREGQGYGSPATQAAADVARMFGDERG